MKTIQYIPVIIILILLLYSCEKEEKQENNLPKTYMDYDDFIKEGLIAYYPFNGSTEDLSGNELNGTGNNLSYSSDRFNIEDGACIFNGENGYVKIENSALLNSTSYTICFWFRADLTDTLYQAILSKSDTAGYGYAIDLINSDHFSDLGFTFRDKLTHIESWSLFGGAWFREWVAGADRKYEFAAVAFSDTDFIDYFGGREENHEPAIFFNSNEYDLYIGKSENGRYENFKGELDDLLIYNRMLTYEEVDKLYEWKIEQ